MTNENSTCTAKKDGVITQLKNTIFGWFGGKGKRKNKRYHKH